jgi:hypothetical protein
LHPSGLNYHGARYLSVVLGRWLSADPLVSERAVSPYAYAANRPTMLVDPTGTDDKETSTAIVAHPGHEPVVTSAYHNFSSFLREFWTGGRGDNGNRRYDSLTSDQTWAREVMDRQWGCTACHVSIEVWNRFGPVAFNPASNLPYDGYIDRAGFKRWVALSAFARAPSRLALPGRT